MAAGVTTTARAVAQYCILLVEAAGKAADGLEGCIVRSRLVTVTLGYVGVMDTPEVPEVVSCNFRFRERVMGPILVIETLLLVEDG